MENSFSSSIPEWSDHPSEYVGSADDPTYPCRILESHQQENCYRYQATLFLKINNWDHLLTFEMCADIPDAFRDICFVGIGNNIPGPHIDERGIEEICAFALRINDNVYEKCVIGAVQQLAPFHTGDAQHLADFCMYVGYEQKPACYREAGRALSAWVTRDESLEEKCSYFKDDSEFLCLHANEIF